MDFPIDHHRSKRHDVHHIFRTRSLEERTPLNQKRNIPRGIRLPNNAIVIDSKMSDGQVIYLCMLDDNEATPFATWIARDRDPESTTLGHYHQHLSDALVDFQQRT